MGAQPPQGGPPDRGIGPLSSWPASPPYQQPAPIPPGYPQVGYPQPGQQNQQYPPPHYSPQPAYGPTGYLTPPADPRWSTGKMFGAVWGFTMLAGPVAGGVLGALLGVLVAGGAGALAFGPSDILAGAVGLGIIFGGFIGAMAGVGMGFLTGLVSAAVAAQTFRTSSPSRCGLYSGLAGGITTALTVPAFAVGGGDVNVLGGLVAFGLIPGTVAGLTVWWIVTVIARRARDADARVAAHPGAFRPR